MVKRSWLWRLGLAALLAVVLVAGYAAVPRGNTVEAKGPHQGPPGRQFSMGAFD